MAMKTVKHIHDISEAFWATIGNFDGVHRGHQQLLHQLSTQAQGCGAKSCVITFTPHPGEVLGPGKSGFLINSDQEKQFFIEQLHIDYFVCLRFTRDFSTKDASTFIKQYLESSYLKGVHLGHDFAFGANKEGSYELLKECLAEKAIAVTVQEGVYIAQEKVSSSRIRRSIREGNLSEASELLGRNFFVAGIVLKGRGRGRQIGFPTANINMDEKRIYPEKGVYVTQSTCRNRTYHSVTNVGVNPTFENFSKVRIETNIFDFDHEIYGEIIKVEFLHKLRAEKKFATENDLMVQIAKDIELARDFFGD